MAAQRKTTLYSFIPSTKVFKTSASLSGFILLAPLAAQAQITPDQTLGAGASQVDRNVNVRGALGDRINGGAIRGVNNFHSFSDFNVLNDQRVYFSNQSGVENIITRVTGGNGSNIYGTLGVDGKANLFLINPNGIVFGPKAQLDVAGSFWAGTSDRVLFSNGESFGTNSSSVPALVEVNIPIGLQMGKNAIAMVRNEAKLVAGKDLGLTGSAVVSSGSLKADRVQVAAVVGNAEVSQVAARSATVEAKQDIVLNSSQLRTTEDLTLKAEGTIQARDTVAKPLAVAAGRDLQVQGNKKVDILALNHPIPAFQAGGDLKLISDGIVSGDSHFISGGNFSILNLNGQSGDFLSLNDPIIRSNRNVTFGTYLGASLKVEARGSIEATGNITINAPDTAATGDPDSAILTARPALILRSGVASIATSTGITVAFVESPITTPGDITVKDIVVGTTAAPGRVILESKNNGTIKLGDVLDTKQGETDLDAQSIDVKAGGVTVNGIVNFKGGIVQGGPINGGAGNEIFNFNGGSIANGLTIDAKDGTNVFNLKGTTFGAGVNLKGGAGSDTVTVDGTNNIFTISGGNDGSVRGANVSAIDIYTGSGTDTVQGMASNDTFQITANKNLTSSGIAFSGIQNLDGKDGSDVYQLNNGVLPSAIAINDTGTLAGDIDRLDYSAYTTDPNVNLAAIGAAGIEDVRGRATAGNSTITALNQSNNWTLDNGGAGTINALSFSNFNRLIGGNLSDTFMVSSGTSGFNLINGGSGANSIDNPTANQTIAISGPNQVLFRGITFQNIAAFQGSGTDTLLGTTGNDIFSASVANLFTLNGVNITGVNDVDALAGNDTVVNNAGAQTVGINGDNQISILGKSFKAIENFTGSGNDTINGTIGNDSFSVTAANTVQSASVNFTGVSVIDDGFGSNTIINPIANQNIAILGPNQGLFRGITFQNISTFQGSGTDTFLGTTGDDTFLASAANTFTSNGINLIGINGFDGSDGNDTVINTTGLQTVQITGDKQISILGKTFKRIENFTGSGSDKILGTPNGDSFSIIAKNTIIAENVVPANAIRFTGVQDIDGAVGNDIFKLDGGFLTGMITGGDGMNTLSGQSGQNDPVASPFFSLSSSSDEFILTSDNRGIARNTGILFVPSPLPGFIPDQFIPLTVDTKFEQIQKIDGRNGTDTLTGTAANETFNLGSLSSSLEISLENLEALNGGGGNDTLQGDSSANLFKITGNNSGSLSPLASSPLVPSPLAFTNIANLQGQAGDDQFVFELGGNITGSISGGQDKDNFQVNSGAAITGTLLGDDDDDIFELNGGSIASQIDGGLGLNTILGTNSDDIFQVTVPNTGTGTVNGASFTNIQTADARDGNDTLKGTNGDDNFVITDAFVATAAGFQAKNFETIDGQGGNNLFTIQSGNLPQLLGGTGIDTVNLEGGTVTTVNLGDGNDLFVLKSGSGTATTVNLGNGDDTVRVEGNGSSISTLNGGTGSLTILGKDNLQGLPTAANSIAGTGVLTLGAIAPKTGIIINDGTTNSTAVAITPTNLQALKPGFTQVLLQGSTIEIQSNVNTTGNQFDLVATAGNINAQNAKFNTNDGNLNLAATGQVNLTDSTLSTTTGNLTIAASTPTITLNNSTIATTTGTLTLNTPTQTLNNASKITTGSGPIAITAQTLLLQQASKITSAGNINITAPTIKLQGNTPATTGTPTAQLSQPRTDRAEIATRSFTPGVSSGNLTLNTTTLTLDNAALIAETGRGAPNGNVRVNFPGDAQSTAFTGKLELKNSSLILAQGDRRSNGDVLITGYPNVSPLPTSKDGSDGNDIITNANPDRQGGAILFETTDNPGRTFTPSAQSFSNAGFRVRKAQVGNGTNDLSSNEAIDLPPPSTQQTDKVPAEFTDPNKLVSSECQPNNRQADRRSQFSISGKGGLPSNPTAVLGAESSQDDWVTLPVPKAPPKPMVKDRPEVIAQAPTKLNPPTNKLAQCLQSWQDSQNVKPQNK